MKIIVMMYVTLSVLVLGSLAAEKPNILWIYAEDTSPWIGCYGDEINAGKTPNIDSMADAGVLFTRAFVPAPVCSATRSALMVGQNSIRFGGHEHRSSRGGTKIHLPDGYKLLPQIMQEHGYTTFNNGKTDYNYIWDQGAYSYTSKSKADFSDLINRQPFFGQIQTKGGKNNTSKFPEARKVKSSGVTVPADYPDNTIFRDVVAQHYDAIRMDDDLIGAILNGLKEAGLAEKTIVVYFSDHGANNLLRHKQMTTEGGLHVPFVVLGPENYVPKKTVRNDLVDMLDLTATTLAWAGIEQPSWYEGQNLFADDFEERSFVGAQKDRLDHTIDRVRSIRTDQYRYVRNYKLDRIFLQPQYRDRKNYTQNLHQLYREGKLSARHKAIYFGERPAEELYEVSIDPCMMQDLAGDPAFAGELIRHRNLMDTWLAVGDLGAGEESVETLKFNGENQKWGEGVNVEYETVRPDSDGDGLSDKWEKLNNRDPNDGLLLFEFDCGGWQTEGWDSDDIKSNLAGYLGYLEFALDENHGTIRRKGLKITASESDEALVIKLRTDADLEISASANGREIGGGTLQGNNEFGSVKIGLDPSTWSGSIQTLEIMFTGAAGAAVEIDSIKVERE
ncbi:Arylsulfatase [Pontiella desulfatans]|uniref:Arylsulfatase n=1 Tax=Pontiella desulfatans TaxID=2750659 RepID=A0A6C2TXK8_PONDE|nr:sulfatase-like hydrolase/transferase [Pontiella desulfatans]SPS73640.1 sulfatase S1_8 [Kiritimatiellales bacterium]VGO11996.1 Arylsulfatase [Pontiella desulfatans]